jgi:ABC-type multidrug transport system fused ATPase/permease subunit
MNSYATAVRASLSVLPNSDRRRIAMVTVVQICLSFLDLIGVVLIGIVGALSVTGIQSQAPGTRTNQVLTLLHISNLGFYKQVIFLSVLAVIFLISRTVLSMIFTQRYLQFLGRRSAAITSGLFSKLINQDILSVKRLNSQETLFLVTEGVRRITVGILGNIVFLISDFSLLLVLTLGLVFVDPIVALVTFVLFGAIALILHIAMSAKAKKLGEVNSNLAIASNKKIIEAINSYREISVRNRRNYYSREIENQRFAVSHNDALLAFMPMISKYVLEGAVVIGAFAIAALQFALNDARHAVATLTIFMAAGSRIGPALMRVQQGVIQIGISIGTATKTIELISNLKNVKAQNETRDIFSTQHENFEPRLEIKNLDFSYNRDSEMQIADMSLTLEPGKTLAVVGSSGAGKTTLVDLIIGILEPQGGSIEIGGQKPSRAIELWPGGISYVPQEVSLIDGSIRENLCMGYPVNAITDEQIWNSIDRASLREFVEKSPLGLETPIGEDGSRISGGQRQRIGIARALITNPRLLILDEATSSLDGNTEAAISDSLDKLKNEVTLVVIAHRLSTVRNADLVIYLDKGEVMKLGNFDEVRNAIPEFDNQAKLMGL